MKHFVGNSQETHRSLVNSVISSRALWEVYYPPFQGAVDAGCLATMCAKNLVNGIPACANSEILQQDLGRMGYKGFIMSDWWTLDSFSALQGVDQEMPGSSGPKSVQFTTERLQSLPEGFLDSMVARILLPVVKYGLMEHPACNPTNGGCAYQIQEVNARSPEHQALARRMVAESVVLLKNEARTLPLRRSEVTLAVLGSACQAKPDSGQMLRKWDVGSYYTVGGSGPVTILEGLQDSCLKSNCRVLFESDAEAAVQLASSADVAIICAGASSFESEDRRTLSVDQESFVMKVSKELQKLVPTVVVTLIPGGTPPFFFLVLQIPKELVPNTVIGYVSFQVLRVEIFQHSWMMFRFDTLGSRFHRFALDFAC